MGGNLAQPGDGSGGGGGGGGITPYKVLRAIAGKSFVDRHFTSTDTALRGALGTYSLGILTVRRIVNEIVTGENEVWFDSGTSNGSGNTGMSLEVSDLSPNKFDTLRARVGDGALVNNDMEQKDSSATSVASGQHHNTSGFLSMVTIVVDDDAYPDDALNVNGRHHKEGFSAWAAGATSGNNFFLGLNFSASDPTKDYIAGLFLQEDALSEEELWLLRQEIEVAHDIPVTPTLSGSPVLDHIWSPSVFDVGTPSSPWTSTGAVGGKILTLAGGGADADLEIAEVNPTFGSR